MADDTTNATLMAVAKSIAKVEWDTLARGEWSDDMWDAQIKAYRATAAEPAFIKEGHYVNRLMMAARAAILALAECGLPLDVQTIGSKSIYAGLKDARPGLDIAKQAFRDMLHTIAKERKEKPWQKLRSLQNPASK